MRPGPILATFVLWASAGCLSNRPGEVADLRRQLDAMRRQQERDLSTQHELENRVFLLEDKLDTAVVAHGKTDAMPHLPVVTKHRPAEEPAAPPAEEIVEDEGPPIEITNDARTTVVAERAGLPSIDGVTDRLPVVPLPKDEPLGRAAGPEPMTVYKSAYAALQRREHTTAISGFEGFLQRWPSHDYADNAEYWLGEAYYDQGKFDSALEKFRRVVKSYPAGNKAPDALLKVGFCYDKLGNAAAARDALTQVVAIYPMTDAAKLAQKRLTLAQGAK